MPGNGWKTILLSITGTLILAMTAQYFVFLRDMAHQSDMEKLGITLLAHSEANRADIRRLEVEQGQWKVFDNRLTTLEITLRQFREYMIQQERERQRQQQE